MKDDAVFRGEGDSERLVIAFTGWTDDSQLEKFAFRDLCRRLGHRHLLLRDPKRLAYLGGVTGQWDSYETLREGLRREVLEVGPSRTVFLGESLGGYAALLFGHELRVKAVHAFGPFTSFDFLEALRDWELLLGVRPYRQELIHLYSNVFRYRRLFGLRRVLANHNGSTRYFVHASRGRAIDHGQAKNLEGLPNVDVLFHPGESHLVALRLARQRSLEAWVRCEGEELDLSGSRVSDEDIPTLAALRNVRRVRLTDTLTTKAGMDRLRRLSPALSIDG